MNGREKVHHIMSQGAVRRVTPRAAICDAYILNPLNLEQFMKSYIPARATKLHTIRKALSSIVRPILLLIVGPRPRARCVELASFSTPFSFHSKSFSITIGAPHRYLYSSYQNNARTDSIGRRDFAHTLPLVLSTMRERVVLDDRPEESRPRLPGTCATHVAAHTARKGHRILRTELRGLPESPGYSILPVM